MSVWRRHLAIGKATTKGTGSIKHAGFRAYFVTSSSFCQKELLLLRLLFFPERTRLIDFFFAPWPVPHSSCMFYILFFFLLVGNKEAERVLSSGRYTTASLRC